MKNKGYWVPIVLVAVGASLLLVDAIATSTDLMTAELPSQDLELWDWGAGIVGAGLIVALILAIGDYLTDKGDGE